MHAVSGEPENTSMVADATAIATVLGGLADADRVQVLLALEAFGELSLNLLSDVVDQAPTTTLDHLTWLRLNRLVAIEQEGARVFYRLLDADLVRALLRVTASQTAGDRSA